METTTSFQPKSGSLKIQPDSSQGTGTQRKSSGSVHPDSTFLWEKISDGRGSSGKMGGSWFREKNGSSGVTMGNPMEMGQGPYEKSDDSGPSSDGGKLPQMSGSSGKMGGDAAPTKNWVILGDGHVRGK